MQPSASREELRKLVRGAPRPGGGCQDVTLLDLVTAVSEVTDDDQEVVATVISLLRSGRVRLCGNFRGQIPDAA